MRYQRSQVQILSGAPILFGRMLNRPRSDIDRQPIRVAITGADGLVGRALQASLGRAEFNITPLDLPEADISNLSTLLEKTEGMQAIIHCAWKNLIDNTKNGTTDPINTEMFLNVYRAAVENNIGRVIMASSNHAHDHSIRDSDGKIRVETCPAVPNNQYGAEKLYMEGQGYAYAKRHNLEVICWRIGNLNDEDQPRPSSPENPQRWLSKRDLGRLAIACLRADEAPGNFQVLYAVSRQPVFDWKNSFGYEPLDSAE